MYGALPNQTEFSEYSSKLISMRALPESLLRFWREFLRSSPDGRYENWLFLGNIEPEGDFSNQQESADRILATMASIIVYWYKYSHEGVKVNTETDNTTIGGHFLSLLHGKDANEDQIRCLDTSLICMQSMV